MPVQHDLLVNGETIAVSYDRDEDRFRVVVQDKQMTLMPLTSGVYKCTIGNRSISAAVVRDKDRWLVEIESVVYEVRDAADAITGGSGHDHSVAKDKIYAPMPGKIVKIMVSVGDEVLEKQPVVIVEAMKMENQVNARAKGRVKAIHFVSGDQVDTEHPIIELELTV